MEWLVKQGILEPVEFAEWAAPIVPVVKSDKSSVCICGDFKLTINKASKLDQYPIPRIEDLFATLNGEKPSPSWICDKLTSSCHSMKNQRPT